MIVTTHDPATSMDVLMAAVFPLVYKEATVGPKMDAEEWIVSRTARLAALLHVEGLEQYARIVRPEPEPVTVEEAMEGVMP